MAIITERVRSVIRSRAENAASCSFDDLLQLSASMHKHLCPRQVLGVRMGLLAGRLLHIQLPQSDKRLFTIVETDGCVTDGISVATNCWVGHRTLKTEDYGKIAATFVDTESHRAIRIAPARDIRDRARSYAPLGCSRWESQLLGYQSMPDEHLLRIQEVGLLIPIEKIISDKRFKAICDECGEEVNNEREIRIHGRILCRACNGTSYYRLRDVNFSKTGSLSDGRIGN